MNKKYRRTLRFIAVTVIILATNPCPSQAGWWCQGGHFSGIWDYNEAKATQECKTFAAAHQQPEHYIQLNLGAFGSFYYVCCSKVQWNCSKNYDEILCPGW